MRAVLTRVKHASVSVDGKVIGQIGEGFLVLLGVTHEDTEAQAVKLADKLTGLRIFEDEHEKMNRSLTDVGGELLIVSQFTLYADSRKGRRPSFHLSAPPDVAEPLFQQFVEDVRSRLPGRVQQGVFAADMDVSLTNWGPVTILLDSADFSG